MKEGENERDNKNEVSRSRFSICAATSDTDKPLHLRSRQHSGMLERERACKKGEIDRYGG